MSQPLADGRAAARRLHMATSPLSQRTRDLERELNHRLFDRDTHRVTLTPAGEALLPIARDVSRSSIPRRLRETTRPGRSTLFMGNPSGLHPRLREPTPGQKALTHFKIPQPRPASPVHNLPGQNS
ncbi:LysR family transcriptional regulator [Streptomyces sp. NPDC002133]|uniref:LysR family transcriptional regulator n=1 Tax=Streptomyces sp. NPDC002133 TaxID=3154409 RepID=UPI00331E05D0